MSIFAAISDPVRRDILALLRQGEASAGAVVDALVRGTTGEMLFLHSVEWLDNPGWSKVDSLITAEVAGGRTVRSIYPTEVMHRPETLECRLRSVLRYNRLYTLQMIAPCEWLHTPSAENFFSSLTLLPAALGFAGRVHDRLHDERVEALRRDQDDPQPPVHPAGDEVGLAVPGDLADGDGAAADDRALVRDQCHLTEQPAARGRRARRGHRAGHRRRGAVLVLHFREEVIDDAVPFAEMVDGCLQRITRWVPDRDGMLT